MQINLSFKKILAFLLSFVMIFSYISVIAQPGNEEYKKVTYLYDVHQVKPSYITNGLSLEADYPGGLLVFPVVNAELQMDDFYAVEIYRLGGTLGETTVTVESMDYTAQYGVNYEIYLSPLKNEQPVKGQASPIYDIEGISYVPTLTSSGMQTTDMSNKSEDSSILYNEYVNQFKDLIKASSTFDITFASGENSKVIYIRTIKDKTVTDDLEFTLTMKSATGLASVGSQNTMGFSITESRPKPPAVLEVVDTAVDFRSDIGYIIVRRSGNIVKKCSYTIVTKSDTAKAGEDYNAVHLQLDFLPGMTEHKIPFDILPGAKEGEQFNVTIQNLSNAIYLNNTATVTFDNLTEVSSDSNSSMLFGTYIPALKNVRDKEYIPVDQFQFDTSTNRGAGNQTSSYSVSSDGKYAELKYNNKASLKNNAIAVRSKDSINFAGVKSITWYIDNYTGSCEWDHNAIYIADSAMFDSNTGDYDFIHTLATDGIGDCWNMINVSEDHIKRTTNDFNQSKVSGEHYLYMMLHKGSFAGVAEYKIYSEGPDSEYNITLDLIKYNLKVLNPDKVEIFDANANKLQSVVPTDSVKLIHPQTGKQAEIIDIYRNEYINITSSFINAFGDYKPELIGFRFCKEDGSEASEIFTVDGTGKLKLTPDVLTNIQSRITSNNIYVKPVYNFKTAQFDVMKYMPKDSAGQKFILNDDGFSGSLYANNKKIGTISWSNTGRDGNDKYMIGDTVKFVFTPEPENAYKLYDLDLKYFVGNTTADVNTHGGNVEGGVAGSNEVILSIKNLITKVYPIVTEIDLGVALHVVNPSYGNYYGKGQDEYEKTNQDDSVTVTGFKNSDGSVVDFKTLSIGEILSFATEPNAGYRAKWTFTDAFSGEKKTYYGDYFFYHIQNVLNANVNVIELEFEKIPAGAKEYTFNGTLLLQKSTILNPADDDMDIYNTVKYGSYTIGNYNDMSDENGVFKLPNKVKFVGDETIRALVFTNHQEYVADIKIADFIQDDGVSISADVKLKHTLNGAFPEKITAVDKDGVTQPQSIVLSKSQNLTFDLYLNLINADENKPINQVKWFFVNDDGTESDNTFISDVEEGIDYTSFSGIISEMAAHGQELWVELLHTYVNDEGKEESQAFGRFNTGYSFYAATIQESVVYSPQIGVPNNIAHPVPSIGPINPIVSFKGLQPVFNVGSAGQDKNGNSIKTITIGISLSTMNDLMKDDKSFGTVSPLKKAEKLMEILGNYDECYNSTGKFPAFAGGEGLANALKMNTAVNFSPSIALCFQANYYIEKGTGDWKFVSTVYVLGFGGKLAVNIPFTFFYVPCFTNIVVDLSLDICLCVMPNTVDDKGNIIPLDINNLWDPSMSEVKGLFKIVGSLTFGVGVGFNAVVSASVNLKAGLNIAFESFEKGKGSMSLSGGVTVEFLFFKYSWSEEFFEIQLFDTMDPSPAMLKSLRSSFKQDIMNSVKLKDMIVETPIDESEINVYSLRNAVLKKEHVISKSPAMINPSIIEIEDGVYLATMVVGVDAEGTREKVHKLYYFIYDENNDTVTEHGFVIDKYLSDLAQKGLRTSIRDNLDTDVQMIDCGEDILIAWTKLGNHISADADNLELIKNIGIATLYYNKATGEFHDYSMTSSDDKKEVFIRPRVVYDNESGLAQLFYEKMNVGSLTLDSTMKELQEMPTTLSMRYNVLDGNSFRWSEEKEIAISENALKYFDVSNTLGRNVLAFVGSEHKGFLLEDASGYEVDESIVNLENFNTKSSLYIQQFYLKDGEVFEGEQIKITDDESVCANPRFAKISFEDKENLLLFFKHNGDYAYQNINNIITQGLYNDNSGEFVLHEDYMTPTYIEYDEELSVNDDLMILSDNNTIYALWTTTEGDQQQIMARSFSIADIEEIPGSLKRDADGNVLYDNNGDAIIEPFATPMYVLKGNWGGRTYLTEGGLNNTESGLFKKDFDAVVTNNGDLLVVFNAYDIDYSDNGPGFKNNNVVVSIYDTASKYVINDSMGELNFSNNYPNFGETVKVRSLITNTGVLAGKDVKVTLYANGEAYAENIYREWLTAETKTVDFDYVLPYGKSAADVSLSIVVTENDEEKCKSSEYSFKSGDLLEIKEVSMIPLKQMISDNDTAKYKVVAKIKNTGNEIYNGGKYIRIMDTDWKNLMTAMQDAADELVVHSSLGQTEIFMNIEPGEEVVISYLTDDISAEVFNKNAGGNSAYFEHYIIEEADIENKTITANEEMSYDSMFFDGLTQAPYIRAVESIAMSDIELSKGESAFMNAEILPKISEQRKDIKYASSDENVAIVNDSGLVIAIGKGECIITAEASNGVKATAKVVVHDNSSDIPGDDVETGDTMNITIMISIMMIGFVSIPCIIRRKRNQL